MAGLFFYDNVISVNAILDENLKKGASTFVTEMEIRSLLVHALLSTRSDFLFIFFLNF